MPSRDTLTRGLAPPAPRRDAARSRRAILDAAERLLTARGGAVHFGVDDFLMVLSMVDGVVERGAAADRTRRSDRTLDLVLGGVLTSRD